MRYLTILRTLAYYDGPQLILGKDGRGTHYLGVAVPTDDPDDYPFLAVGVTQPVLDDYFDKRVDLRYVFKHAKRNRYFRFSAKDQANGRFRLKEIQEVPDPWLPEAGIFASSDANVSSDLQTPGISDLRIPIDGAWDMQDLAVFPNIYTDAYAFSHAVSRQPPTDGEWDPNIEIFSRYPWAGGFSVVGFYNDLYRQIPRRERLQIRELAYASPGHIRIQALSSLTAEMQALVERLNEHWSDLHELYRQLQGGLSERKLLGRRRSELAPTAADKAFAHRATQRLCDKWGFVHLARVHALCEQDWIHTAKVLLSFYRRVEDLADFFESGKASFDANSGG